VPLLDRFSRPLRNLRLSVTDRCNLRCAYCMPEENYVWLPREDLLNFEEISTLVDVFASLGVDKVRLTGGEPLLRRDVPDLVRMLAGRQAIRDLALTTNGVLLPDQGDALKAAGLHRITVSLDTLRRDRFAALTRVDELERVKEGIRVAARLWPSTGDGDFPRAFKIDTVVIRGVNDDELSQLLDYAKTFGAEIRFIEYMDVGGATQWSQASVVSRVEMLETLEKRYGRIEPLADSGSAPADRYALPDGTTFGIISSTTEPFCRDCDRSRLTADGMWFLCLYAVSGTDLRAALRGGASPGEIREMIASRWSDRIDRGAEDRLALGARRAFVPVQTLKKDPHLEMHTRGG